ncbi:type II secretion system F family protein [Haliovirga abyssi]|uniref:Type II secretion system protein F n=1 Tax=Haliovirga abyssi TaxID=2996794 RepID=A0AAU9D7L9_9FUSO|nr:type II secretion system F family protein [Haliovirga abyssi]BDU49566.1 type II secretion system protein F [Haliovirga abyssi]
MFNFKYTAIDKQGNKKNGELQAKNEKDLKSALKAAGFILIKAQKKGGSKSGSSGSKSSSNKTGEKKVSMFSRVTLKELTIFSRQLATMISSGVTLLKAITILSEQNENPLFKQKLTQIKSDIESGQPFSNALSKHPKQFDKLYVSMVRAGEESGALEVVLNRLATSMEKNQELRGKVKGAMMYPAIVMIVALSITFMLLTFVVPTFTSMFKDAGMQLPGLTQKVVDVSDFLRVYWWVVIIGVILLVVGIKKYINTPKGRKKLDGLMLKLPIMGSFTRKVSVGRFTRTMATLLDSGVPILMAFDIVSETVGNEIISEAIMVAKSSIKEGNTIAKPLADSGEFPLMVTQMIEIGEESGSISEMLSKVADFNEREVEEAVAVVVSAMEPLAIVVMAIIVGTIVIAMFLPMFKLSDLAG